MVYNDNSKVKKELVEHNNKLFSERNIIIIFWISFLNFSNITSTINYFFAWHRTWNFNTNYHIWIFKFCRNLYVRKSEIKKSKQKYIWAGKLKLQEIKGIADYIDGL